MDIINNEPKPLKLIKKLICNFAVLGFVLFLVIFIVANFGVDISDLFSELSLLHVGHLLILLGVLTMKDAFVKPLILAVYIAIFFFMILGDIAASGSRTGLLVACGNSCAIASYWVDVVMCILDYVLLLISCAEFILIIFIMKLTKQHQDALDFVFKNFYTKKEPDKESMALAKKTMKSVGLSRERMPTGKEDEEQMVSAFDDQ